MTLHGDELAAAEGALQGVDERPEPRPGRWVLLRILISGLLLLGTFGIVGWRAHRLQVDDGARLREMAEQQYLKEMELPPRRGAIYDRHGAPLALSVDVDSVYANPRMIGDVDQVAARLARVLSLDSRTVRQRLLRRRYFVWIKRRVSAREARAVERLKIRGVMLTQESKRFYPNQGLGGVVVGFSGLDSRGLEGIELSHDLLLRGQRKRVVGLRDALGRPVFTEGAQSEEPSGGHDLVLALDKFIQHETERALQAALSELRPGGWVAVVAMDPRTGDVLAMASAPSFDPNRYAQAKLAHRRNRTITDAFEPGSTLKVFTVAGALDRGVIRADEVVDCERGAWRIGRHVIRDTKPLGKVPIADILVTSSNIGTSKIAFKLGRARLHATLRDFGFGAASGSGLRGERAGVLRPPQRWSNIGLSNIGFGQGMTATVLQLARGFSAIANHGRLMRPRLVLEMRDPSGTTQEVQPAGQQVVRRAVADAVLRMLAGVTREGGTATQAALDHYTVAGKTGTAQKVDPVTGTYSKELWVSSFVGIAPASRPRLTIAVIVNEPGGTKYYGGEVAGPIFRRIAARALRYLGVPPDREAPPAREALAGDPREAPATIPEATPAELAPPLPGAGFGRGRVVVPDFTGMSMAEVLAAARKARLRVSFEGSGHAVAQSPGPGQTQQRSVRVAFSPPG